MISVKTKTHIGSDGTLTVEVPITLRETDVEVMLVLQPVSADAPRPESLGWPIDFFEQTAGAWQGEPLERGLQGEYEVHEAIE